MRYAQKPNETPTLLLYRTICHGSPSSVNSYAFKISSSFKLYMNNSLNLTFIEPLILISLDEYDSH